MAALVSITLLSRLFTDFPPVPRRLPDCFPRYFLHLGYDGAYALRNSLPLNGVTSMSFRPGCHRPFHRSACICSLLLPSQDCVLSLFGSVSFASAIPDLMLQHFLTSSVVTLRPFALSLYSWRVLFLRKVRESNPRAIADLLLSREMSYHSANLPCSVCRNVIAAITVTHRYLLLSAIQLQFFASAIRGTPLLPAYALSS